MKSHWNIVGVSAKNTIALARRMQDTLCKSIAAPASKGVKIAQGDWPRIVKLNHAEPPLNYGLMILTSMVTRKGI